MTVTTAVSTGNIWMAIVYIGIGATVISTVLFIVTVVLGKANSSFTRIASLVLLLGSLALMCIGGFAVYSNHIEHIHEYTVYIDGQEVDSDKIDASLYDITFDDENGVAYATHR